MKFLLDNALLVGTLLASGTYLLLPLLQRALGGMGAREIGTLEATRLINSNALVIDVRDAAEFAAGHIPSARHVPAAELAKRAGEWARYREKPVLLICKAGLSSAAAARILLKNEFTQVYQLRGGVAAWQSASLPLEKA